MWLRFPRSKVSPSLVYGLSAMGVVGASSMSFNTSALCQSSEKIALSGTEFRSFPVRHVEAVTHDVKRIIFDLPGKDWEMGMITSSCIVAKASIDGKSIVRAYTPTNLNTEKGFLELIVKGYPTGKLSRYITDLKQGDTLELKGPFVKFPYQANQYKKIGLIAGGSGITPMLQLIKTICRDPKDHTEIVLLFANKTKQDIILQDELDALRYLYPQLTIHYILSHETESSWNGLTGHVTKEMIQELLPCPSDDHLIGVCGPPPMMYAISGDKAKDKTQGELQGILKDLNYTSTQVFKY